jgi:hypothetical protein
MGSDVGRSCIASVYSAAEFSSSLFNVRGGCSSCMEGVIVPIFKHACCIVRHLAANAWLHLVAVKQALASMLAVHVLYIMDLLWTCKRR